MLVLHYTGMQTGEAALARLRDPAAEVSAHYLVEEDGRDLPPGGRGTPGLARRTRRLAGRDRRQRRLHRRRDRQSGPRVRLSRLSGRPDRGRHRPDRRHPLALEHRADARIIGHSDLAPERKEDPGELFPWKRLAQAGHGLWFEPPPPPGAPLGEGEEGTGVFALQAGLTRLGYDCAPTGKFDARTTTIVSAFQRHWLQTSFDGVADGETRARLVGLLRAGD
jgi:N-acetylmuramoyl-L-alanine amidase